MIEEIKLTIKELMCNNIPGINIQNGKILISLKGIRKESLCNIIN